MMDFVTTGNLKGIRTHLETPDSARRLAIYRNTFLSSCVDSIQRKYPSAEKLLGEDYFKNLAREYALSTPPTSPILGEYGASFPEYIQGVLNQHQPELTYVWDVCQLDRAWHQAYFAANKAPLDEAGIEALVTDIDIKTVSLHPSVQLIQLDWDVAPLWAQLRDSNVNEEVSINHSPNVTVLWRDGSVILHRTLLGPEAAFISCIYEGQTLGESAETAMGRGEIDISSIFSQLLLNNLIV